MKLRMTAAFLALATFASIASAGEIKPFSQAEFDRLTQAGQPVVVDVSATWCPTCKAQKPILETLMKQPAPRRSVKFLRVWSLQIPPPDDRRLSH
ncbi:TPA: thioredoxin family protein [Pseudomonas aeruginosa]|nr:thioredoxin family protein [Pseudomonas aeruginosa]